MTEQEIKEMIFGEDRSSEEEQFSGKTAQPEKFQQMTGITRKMLKSRHPMRSVQGRR